MTATLEAGLLTASAADFGQPALLLAGDLPTLRPNCAALPGFGGRAFIGGCLLGASGALSSSTERLLPAPDAAILADDFDSPRALAEHLAALAADEAAYARHLAWKQRPFAARFERLLRLGSVESRVRLAVKLAHGCDRSCACGGRVRPIAG